LQASDARREDVMLGLRLSAGVPAEDVVAAGLSSALESLRAEGLVELVGGAWRTTRTGWLLGNEVFARVWLTDGENG
jgi:coproporphyrinogen III oxidase-like Fe-S oxidoreductase